MMMGGAPRNNDDSKNLLGMPTSPITKDPI